MLKYLLNCARAGRSQWTLDLMSGSAAAHLLGLRVRIPPEAWISVSSDCCVLSGRGLCVGLVTCPGEPYGVWCVWVWSRILDNEETLAHWGVVEPLKKMLKKLTNYRQLHELSLFSRARLEMRFLAPRCIDVYIVHDVSGVQCTKYAATLFYMAAGITPHSDRFASQ